MEELRCQKLKNYFAGQQDIEFALVFGSAVSGRETPMSDIDVAVYLQKEKDLLKLGERQIEITCDLMKLFGVSRVDVVILNTANPFLRFQVMKYGKLVCAKDEKIFYRFKALSFGLYQDIKPMYDLYDKITEVNLRKGL